MIAAIDRTSSLQKLDEREHLLMSIVDITKQQISRRSFLKGASFGIGIPVLAELV